MCLPVSYKEKCEEKNNFFSSLNSQKKGVGSRAGVGAGVGPGTFSQRSGSADPDPHHDVTDPQHFIPSTVLSLAPWILFHLITLRYRTCWYSSVVDPDADFLMNLDPVRQHC